MVNTRGLRGVHSISPKSVYTRRVQTRSSVKPSPPLPNPPCKPNATKGHGSKAPSLRRTRKCRPQICQSISELSSGHEASSSPSNSPSSLSANATPSTSLSYTSAQHESEDDDYYTSAAPSVSSSDDELYEANTGAAALPSRLFSTDRYPTEGRVNSYSRPQYLVDILSVLDGSSELRTLMQSPFRSLFQLPVRRCLLSGKLVHNFLSRQLFTKNSDELWFTFGGYPLRFSLAEFEKVTGLPCGPYPDKETLTAAQKPSDPENPYWNELIGPEKEITIEAIVIKLKTEPGMHGWKKLALSLIVIVEGVLICGTQPIRASFPIVEMVKDLKFFFSYPWGRHSFEYTIRMVKVGKQVPRSSRLLKKMKQHSLVLHGFPIAIQLMIFQSVPLLLRYLPFSDDLSTFNDRFLPVLPKLKTYHTHNILSVENDTELSVTHIVAISSPRGQDSNVACLTCDPKVLHMMNLIEEGYAFSKVDWRGGDDSLERLCICNKKKHRTCKCGSSLPTHDNGTPSVRRAHSGPSATAEIATLRAQIIRLEKQSQSMGLKLKADLLSEMRALFASQQCGTCKSNSRGAEFVSPDQNRRPVPSGLHTPPTPNIGNPFESDENYANRADYDPPNHEPSPQGETDDVGHHQNHVAEPANSPPLLSPFKVNTAEPQTALRMGLGSEGFTLRGVSTTSSKDEGFNHSIHVEPSVTVNSDRLHLSPSHSLPTKVCGGKILRSINDSTLNSPVEEGQGPTSSPLHLRYGIIHPCPLPLPDVPPKCAVSTTSSVRSSRKRGWDAFVPPRIFNEPKPFKRPRTADREHIPFVEYRPRTISRFKKILRDYPEETYDIDGVNVSKTFFEDIYTPHKWLHRTHMDCIIRPFWTKRGGYLVSNGIVVHDTLLTDLLSAQYRTFGTPTKAPSYVWDSHLTSCVEGCVGDRVEVTKWFRDIHTIYAPMNWGNHHWVFLCISLLSCDVEILDPFVMSTSDKEVASYMEPFMRMLPLLIKETCHPADITHLQFLEFSYERLEKLPQTKCAADSGPFAIKMMEMHSHRLGLQGFGDIPDDWVEMFRMQYAIEGYLHFIGQV